MARFLRKSLIVLIFSVIFLYIYGCETLVGTSRGAVKGARKDCQAAQKAAKAAVEAPGKIDQQMREELW